MEKESRLVKDRFFRCSVYAKQLGLNIIFFELLILTFCMQYSSSAEGMGYGDISNYE